MKYNLLNHLAIIMDGNGRWAKERNLSNLEGHKYGAATAKKVIEIAVQEGIKHLSLYTFSSENWNRPSLEVNDLMNLFHYYITNEAEKLNENGVKLKFIGNLSRLDKSLQKKMQEVTELTCNNTNLNLYVAISYGGREELVEACRKVVQAGIQPESINEDIIKQNLYAPEMPDIDMLIRPGGERRISNFLLWHIAYTELYFTDVYWPDFGKEELDYAVEEFKKRTRNFGHSRNVE